MRNLTIRRTKTFVGCLTKMKVYIEDPASNEISINNTPCRKIGFLKNGEEKTFQIGNEAVKVFVIADTISKGFCNEYYQLSEGEEDVFLSGKNKFNPANGNAFRFDNNEIEEVLINRKRGTRKGLIVLVVAAIVGGIAGYAVGSDIFSEIAPEPKTFSSEGITVTLTDEFDEVDFDDYTVSFDSKDVAVFALKDEFAWMPELEDYTVDQYIELLMKGDNLVSPEVKADDDLTYFVYEFTNPETKDTYRYFSYVYKADEAFWIVQFATLDKNAEEYSERITEWAKSVEFND